MLFGLFDSEKRAQRNLDFHTERVCKLLRDAHEHFERADSYLCGEGFGDRFWKIQSAQGATKRAISALKEAAWNIQKATQYCSGDSRKLQSLSEAVALYRGKNGNDLFASDEIAQGWDKAVTHWYQEIDSVIGVKQ